MMKIQMSNDSKIFQLKVLKSFAVRELTNILVQYVSRRLKTNETTYSSRNGELILFYI